jgi:cell division protein FtsZ
LTLHEINEAVSVVLEASGRDANVIFGAVIDEAMGDAISITVIATGFGRADERAKPGEAARAQAGPRIFEFGARERAARPAPLAARAVEGEDSESARAPAAVSPAPAGRPMFRMAPGTLRRPFGGRAITKDNMDVPAFMRKQMD